MIEKLPYEELASWYRSASELNKKYVKEISQLKSQLQQKDNIIKEVREYANNIMFETKAEEKIQDDILDIVNKILGDNK